MKSMFKYGFWLFLASACGKINMNYAAPLFYRTEGAGAKDILLLHGLLASNSAWDGITPTLAKQNKLVLVDLLGFGDSPKPKTDYTVQQHLFKIEEALKSESSTPEIIVAHSMGTFLALNYAIAHPQQIKKLVLINAPMVTSKERLQAAIAESSSKFMVAMTFNETWGKLVCHVHELFPSISYPFLRLAEPELPKAMARAAGQHTYASYHGSLTHVLMNQNFYQLLSKVNDISVLILASDKDEYTKDSALEKLPQHKNIKLVRLPGGHNNLITDPDVVTKEISAFLE